MTTSQLPDNSPPEDVVFVLQSWADQLNTSLLGYDPDDWRDALRLLDKLRKVTRTLGTMDSALSQWLYLHGEHGMHQHIDGVAGEFSIGRGREKERWASEQGVRDYVDQKMHELEGEVPDPAVVVGWVLEVLPATASTSLRKTPLRAVGLDVGDYYASEPGTIRVDLPKPT